MKHCRGAPPLRSGFLINHFSQPAPTDGSSLERLQSILAVLARTSSEIHQGEAKTVDRVCEDRLGFPAL
ncbi:hypothetical protein WN50_16145 [Limnoraphis robusta CS-951]|uniref:Uncharacterized protein n=1 Tax=Limnoraphis robusta CS-951 TaxID=1637645 RepID=A0A0F5YE02_9CYAN|nr:hypothetical protein WN50_16145 [Limnoraphis robusta CS-951]